MQLSQNIAIVTTALNPQHSSLCSSLYSLMYMILYQMHHARLYIIIRFFSVRIINSVIVEDPP